MVGIGFLFGLCAYYVSLSHSIISLCKVYNARQRLGKMYIIFPMVFAFVCVIASAFIIQDAGIKDFLVDGITDGSLSELLHVIIIFMLIPYVLYSVWVVHAERKKLGDSQQQQQHQPVMESGILADKDLFTRHIKYIVVFLVTIIPGCLAELLPMLWKTIPRSFTYHFVANVSAVCFSCSGLGVSIVRLYDPYVKEKIQSAIAALFEGEFREVSIEIVNTVPEMLRLGELNKSEGESINSSSPAKSARSRATTARTTRKTIFEQVEERAVYDVSLLILY